MISRRDFLEQSAFAFAGATSLGRLASHDREVVGAPLGRLNVRTPDAVAVQTANEMRQLRAVGAGRWEGAGVTASTVDAGDALRVQIAAPAVGVRRMHLRWNERLDHIRLILGDAWERGYGDLEWRSFVPDRVMPWYVALWDGRVTRCHGVRTGAAAFCFWQVDQHGVSLWADVRSGGSPIQLGERTLAVCDIVSRDGRAAESSFAAIHAFCAQMCANPRRPAQPVYGSNDWYWAYGKNSAATVLADAQHIVELSPSSGNRPFCVIDDGWQPDRGEAKTGVGTWDHGNEKFGDMAVVAADIRKAGARPGIWTRPLLSPATAPDSWRLARDRNVLDPTIDDVRQKVVADLRRLRDWGYELIKHDYSTFDIFGRWGFQMGSAMTRDGWTFASGPTRTTAEVINDLYHAIREGAGDALVIGCNTVSHLSAGVFEICRIGDDTSGREWLRTAKMGVNTLAFRGAQHGAFYTADADCVGVTTAVPWSLNRQWLDLLARSGTMLFVSLAPDALGAEQRRDLRSALSLAAQPQPLGEPLDWQRTAWPTRWRLMKGEQRYDWLSAEGLTLPPPSLRSG